MSIFALSPSVTTTELDYTFSVPAVSTSSGGFAGTFQWGPALQITNLSSPAQLLSKFYQPNDATAVSYFTAENYLQYSQNLNLVRVVGLTAVNATSSGTAALIANSDVYYANFAANLTTNGTFAAKYPGALGNGLRVSICDATGFKATLAGTVTASLASPNVTGVGTSFTTQTAPGCLLTDALGNVIGRVLTVTSATALVLTSNAAFVETSSSGVTSQWEFAGQFSGAPGTSAYTSALGGSNDQIHVVVQDTLGNFSAAPGTILATYPFLSKAYDAIGSDGSSIYYKNVINRQDASIWHMSHPTSGTNWGNNAQSTAFVSLTGPTAYLMTGGISNDTLTDAIAIPGFMLFSNTNSVDVGLIPLGGASPVTADAVISNVTTVRQDCLAFISPKLTDVYQNAGMEAASIIATRNLMPSTSYAVMDSGWKYQYDRYNDVYRWIPLNGDVAGLCAQISAQQNDWVSPAGYVNGQIKNVVKLAYNPSINDRNELFPLGINPVITQKGQGTFLFGDATLLSSPSTFGEIGVRRLFILIEKAISQASKYILFRNNNSVTRSTFLSGVNPFLRTIKGAGGIVNYVAVCDTTNNTSDVINAESFVAQFYISPSLSIRNVQLQFINTPQGSSMITSGSN